MHDSRSRPANLWTGGRCLRTFVSLLVLHTCAASLQQDAAVPTTAVTFEEDPRARTVVNKCCGRDEIVVVNKCRRANDTKSVAWTPEFTASNEDEAVAGQKTLPDASVLYRRVRLYIPLYSYTEP